MLSDLLKKSMPVYELYLPSKNKKVSFRPMTVKEEKILLLAQNEAKISTIALAIGQILQNCFENIDNPENLELIDVQKAFLNLRSKSMGEDFVFQIKCPYTGDDLKLNCNLKDFKEKIDSIRKNTIKINENITILMKNPSLSYFIEKQEEDSIKELFVHCFQELHSEHQIITKSETSIEEIQELFDSFTVSQYEKVVEYFQSIPKMELTIQYVTKDKVKREITFNGLDSFFELASVI